MIIFKDRIYGDELFTDAGSVKYAEDGSMITFHAKQITIKEGEDIKLEGANPSQEEQEEEQSEASSRTELDFVAYNRLEPFEFGDKKGLQQYFKGYFKALRTKMVEEERPADEIKAMENLAKATVVEFSKKHDNLSLYRAGTCNEPTPLCIIFEWGDDGMSGTAHVFRQGVIEEKV